jgi:hypothetical protein
MAKTLYQILGVPADATPEAIGAAHLRLVERVPPLDAVQRLAVKEAYGTPFRTIAASITGQTAALPPDAGASTDKNIVHAADDLMGGHKNWSDANFSRRTRGSAAVAKNY